MPIAVIVDWYGPYRTLQRLENAVVDDWHEVSRALYMAYGRGNICRYIGLSTAPVTRITGAHPKLADLDNTKFFVGEIVTQGISGPRNGVRPPDLSLAEHALISFLQPALNTNLRDREPGDLISIFSCFYNPRDETAINPLPKFPALLAFNPYSEQRWFY